MDSRVEFLKHLRFVHFTLVVTALVVVVASNLTPSYVMESAYQQSVEIRRFARALWQWAKDKNIPDLRNQIVAVHEKSPLYLVEDGKAYGPLIFPDYKGHINFEVNEASRPFLERNYLSGDAKAPATLEDFSRLWDELHHWNSLLTVTGWDGEGSRIQGLPGIKKIIVIGSELPAAENRVLLKNERRFRLVSPPGQKDAWDLIIDFNTFAINFCDRNDPFCGGPYVPMDYRGSKGGLLPIENVRIPLKSNALTEVDFQEQAVQALGVSWAPGTFSNSFNELAELASSIDSLRLDDLKNHFAKLRSEQGASIELLGAKIPLGAFRTWGLVILVGVQLYFALHLERYLRAFAAEAREDVYPWIGVYKSLPARFAFAVTAAFLPMGATGFVLQTEADPEAGLVWTIVTWGLAAGSLATAAFTFSQVVRIHLKQR